MSFSSDTSTAGAAEVKLLATSGPAASFDEEDGGDNEGVDEAEAVEGEAEAVFAAPSLNASFNEVQGGESECVEGDGEGDGEYQTLGC